MFGGEGLSFEMNSCGVHGVEESQEVEDLHFGGSFRFEAIFGEYPNQKGFEGGARLERVV